MSNTTEIELELKQYSIKKLSKGIINDLLASYLHLIQLKSVHYLPTIQPFLNLKKETQLFY
jgi:hypothetical protein